MNGFLVFLAVSAGIVALGWIVSRITGARASFLENWVFEPGETVRWGDDKADVLVVPRWGGAVVMSPVRAHRWAVVATDRRVILANRSITGKRMVMYVLWLGASPDPQSRKWGGGLLTRGYTAMAIAPEMTTHPDERLQKPYVALVPAGAEASSFNVKEVRVYTDDWAGMDGV